MVLPSSDPQMLQHHPASKKHLWFNSGPNIMGGNYNLLDLKPPPEERIHAWYCKPGQKPVSLGPTSEHTRVVLLNGYVDKLPSKYVYI